MHKILIVEDTREIREEICDILIMEGYNVSQAENGSIGFEMALKENPDLIISDIYAPEFKLNVTIAAAKAVIVISIFE